MYNYGRLPDDHNSSYIRFSTIYVYTYRGRRCIRGRVLFEGTVYLTRTELDEGRSQEAMDNFFEQSHYTDSPQTKLFYSAHYVRFIY